MAIATTQAHLYIGTRKGGFVFSSDPKRKDQGGGDAGPSKWRTVISGGWRRAF
jgi:hypothetical protein